jgi:hypothetical protein
MLQLFHEVTATISELILSFRRYLQLLPSCMTPAVDPDTVALRLDGIFLYGSMYCGYREISGKQSTTLFQSKLHQSQIERRVLG